MAEARPHCGRRTAIEAGAVPALCSVLGTGDDEPVSLDVLKALYSLIAPDTTGAPAAFKAVKHILSCSTRFALIVATAQATHAARCLPRAACTPWYGPCAGMLCLPGIQQ